MKCLVTDQGTGATETGLCYSCYPHKENQKYAREMASRCDDIDPNGEFVDCGLNDAIGCCVCIAEVDALPSEGKMRDDFETVMGKMGEIHNLWPLLRFCQVIELATATITDNFNLTDDDLITALDERMIEMPASKKDFATTTTIAGILKEVKEDWRGGTPIESILNNLDQQVANYFEATIFGFDRTKFFNTCELGE